MSTEQAKSDEQDDFTLPPAWGAPVGMCAGVVGGCLAIALSEFWPGAEGCDVLLIGIAVAAVSVAVGGAALYAWRKLVMPTGKPID